VNDLEQDEFEAELRRIKPAEVPRPLLKRLILTRPKAVCRTDEPASRPAAFASLALILRWAGAVTGVGMAAFISWRSINLPGFNSAKPDTRPAGGLKADGVEVDQRLVSSFDTVARLPGGEPVRFRVQNWMDRVVLKDRNRGIVIDHSNPRVEVVPVSLEVY